MFHILLSLAKCHISLKSKPVKMLEFYYLSQFVVVHFYRFQFIHTTGNISFNSLLIILRSISCCHLPLFFATCHISLKNFPVKMIDFYHLSQFPVVNGYSFPYIHTTGNISFTLLIFMLCFISCCHLP